MQHLLLILQQVTLFVTATHYRHSPTETTIPQPMKGGTQLNAGAIISTTTTLYVYAKSTVDPSCTNEHPFTVTINTTPTVDTPADVTSCDSYTLPALTVGKYFTAPNGGGTQLNDGETYRLQPRCMCMPKQEQLLTVVMNMTLILQLLPNLLLTLQAM